MPIQKSKWSLATANAVTGSVLLGTMGGGEFLMEPDDQKGVIYRFPYIVAGIGVSPMPVGLDFSHESMPGTGTRVIQWPNKLIKPTDFIGFFRVMTVEANFGPGVAAAVLIFGVGPFWEKGYCALTGGQVGIPTVGISGCFGYVIDWY
ncbi:hypothetical protein [Spirosoma luteum]|uniref:hypothetical protein n=1 Tax=Spirosoma luteum TaxID=431553 RepID=UPI0012FB71CB|nr:hypothetical protein [Spirosoma luteum]